MREKKILINYILYFLAFIVVCILGISRPLAATIKTIYPSNNFSQNANNYLKLNESGTFGITNTNLTIQGQSYGFNFYMQENVVLNKTYTIVITFMADDLRSDFQNNYVHVNVGSGSTSSSVSIVSITRNNPSGYSTTLTIKFNPLTTGDYIQVNIISDGPPYAVLTGVSTYGIKSVTLDSSADTQDIINNQNQNTQDIINAQQSSASNIISSQESSASAIQDTLNSNFNSTIQCNNLVDISTVSLNMSNRLYSYNIPQTLEAGTYTLSYEFLSNNSLSKRIQLWLSSDNNTTQYFNLSDNGSVTFTMNNSFDRLQFFISSSASANSSFSIKNIKLEKGNTSTSYCAYGSSSSVNKLDQQTDAINDLNDSINSTDFDISDLDNVVGWLPPGPIDSILNLPLNLFNAYNTALGLSCTTLNIPLPFVNQNLPIPCIRSIFDDIGISTWWEGFGYLVAGIMLYNYLLNLYTWVDKTLTLRENTMPGYYDDNFGGGA